MAKRLVQGDKPGVCRITCLKAFGGVLIGRDLHGIFKDGHVYAVEEWLGTKGTVNQYITSGVTMLTKAEYERELKTK